MATIETLETPMEPTRPVKIPESQERDLEALRVDKHANYVLLISLMRDYFHGGFCSGSLRLF